MKTKQNVVCCSLVSALRVVCILQCPVVRNRGFGDCADMRLDRKTGPVRVTVHSVQHFQLVPLLVGGVTTTSVLAINVF